MAAFYEDRDNPFVYFRSLGITFSPHLHKQVELLFVESGKIRVALGNQSYEVGKGDLAVVFPNIVHSYETTEESSCAILIFDLDYAGDYAGQLTGYQAAVPILHNGNLHKDISYCFKALKKQWDQAIPNGIVKGYLSVILGRIFEVMPIEKPKRDNSSTLTHKALLFVTEHFREQISLDLIAKNIGTSKYYLSRIFSTEIGMGFNQYINGLRVGYAQHLLGNPSLSITGIAYDCGFDSQRTFNRAFRTCCGITPKEYRKQLVFCKN